MKSLRSHSGYAKAITTVSAVIHAHQNALNAAKIPFQHEAGLRVLALAQDIKAKNLEKQQQAKLAEETALEAEKALAASKAKDSAAKLAREFFSSLTTRATFSALELLFPAGSTSAGTVSLSTLFSFICFSDIRAF